MTALAAGPRMISRPLAVACVVVLWLIYSIMQTLSVLGRISLPIYAVIGFLPGLVGVGLLLAAGLSREDCFLALRRPSGRGLWVLAAVMILAWSAMLPFGEYQGWSWLQALVYAPVGGISQELFFRSSLLPAMRARLKGRPRTALVLHAVLFGLWHIGPLFLGAPLGIVFAIMFVPFLSGLGWGWQVERDGTVLWAMVQHSLIWVVGLQFAFGG